MKRIKNLIKLTNLNSESLNEKELSHVSGGVGECYCGCFYETSEGSSTFDNETANDAKDLTSIPPVG